MAGPLDPVVANNYPPMGTEGVTIGEGAVTGIPQATFTNPNMLHSGTAPNSPSNPNGYISPVDVAKLMHVVDDSATDLKKSTDASWQGGSLVGTGANTRAAGQNIVDAAQMMVQMQRRAADTASYAAFGTSPGAENRISILAREQADLEGQFRERQKMIQGKLDANFLDNPITWLSNQISLPFDVAAAENIHAQSEADKQQIHFLAISTQESVQLNAAAAYNSDIKTLTGTALINKGVADETAGKAVMEAGHIGVAGAGTGGALANVAFEGPLKEAHLSLDTTRADLAQKQFLFAQTNTGFEQMLQSAAANRAAEQHVVTMEINKAQSGTMQEQVVARHDLDNRLRQAYSLIYGGDVKPITYQQLTMMADGRDKAALLSLISQPDIQRGVFGNTPVDAMNTVAQLRAKLPIGSAVLYKQMDEIAASTVRAAGFMEKGYTPEQVSIFKNDAIKQAAKVSYGNIKESGDIYSPTTLRQTLQLPEVVKSKLAPALAILADPAQDRDGTYPTKAVDIVGAAKALMLQQGSNYTPALAAAEVSTMFKAIANQTDELKLFNRLGLTSLVQGGEYKTNLDNSNGTYGVQTVNMLNKAELEAYFTRFLATNAYNPPQDVR